MGTAISAGSRIALPAAGRRKKHMEKRRKKYKIILALGSIICFLLVPFIMIKTEVKADPSFGMVQFFPLIFWPMAGLTLSILCHESTGMENNTSGNDGCLDSDSESDTSAAAIFPVLSMHYI